MDAFDATPPTNAVKEAKAAVNGTGSHSVLEGKSFCFSALSTLTVILVNISEEPHPREVVERCYEEKCPAVLQVTFKWTVHPKLSFLLLLMGFELVLLTYLILINFIKLSTA